MFHNGVCVCVPQNISNCTLFIQTPDRDSAKDFFQSKIGETWHAIDVLEAESLPLVQQIQSFLSFKNVYIYIAK